MNKIYEVHYVERAGFPGAHFETVEAPSDKALKQSPELELLFNRSINRGHCGIRVFRLSDGRCIYKRFKGA